MTPETSRTPAPGAQDEEERQIEAQFAGLDNDLVEVEAADGRPEARDETLDAEDVDETSAGGLRYPEGVRTSKPEAGR